MLDTNVFDPFTFNLLCQNYSDVSTELTSLKNAIQQERRSRLDTEDTNSEFFCSHSTAVVLKAMGVLPQSVPATEYLPYSFTSEMGLPLLRGATFSNEVFLRGKQEDIFCSLGGQPAGFLAEALKKILEEREMDGHVEEQATGSIGNSSSSTQTADMIENPSNVSKKDESGIDNSSSSSSERGDGDENEDKSPSSLSSPSSVMSDLTTLLSPEDLRYLYTQLHLTRSLGRTEHAKLQSLLHEMNV